MGSPISDAVLGAVEGVTNFGFGLYDRYKQDKLNRIQQEREDSAYQRAVADAHLAGLSKASISGPSSSTPLTAPKSPDVDIFSRAQQAQANRLSMMQQQADISKTLEESKNIQFQNMKFDAESKYFSQNALNEASMLVHELGLKSFENSDDMKKALYNLRLANIDNMQSSADVHRVVRDINKVQLAFDLFKEKTLLGSQKGEFGTSEGEASYHERRNLMRAMYINEIQAKLEASKSSILGSQRNSSQYKADKTYFDYYLTRPSNYRTLRDSKDSFTTGAVNWGNALNDMFGF